MAKKKDGVNRSEEIRQLLKTKPELGPKEIMSTLAERGIHVSGSLVQFVKGRLKGRQDHKQKTEKAGAKAAGATKQDDPLTAIRMVKVLASRVGGMKKLKALVDAMSD
jgi:hypothetical protein